MKKSNTCPICQSKNIAYDDQSDYVLANTIQGFRVDRYICTDCGHVEEWMNDLDIFNNYIDKYGEKYKDMYGWEL